MESVVYEMRAGLDASVAKLCADLDEQPAQADNKERSQKEGDENPKFGEWNRGVDHPEMINHLAFPLGPC